MNWTRCSGKSRAAAAQVNVNRGATARQGASKHDHGKD